MSKNTCYTTFFPHFLPGGHGTMHQITGPPTRAHVICINPDLNGSKMAF